MTGDDGVLSTGRDDSISCFMGPSAQPAERRTWSSPLSCCLWLGARNRCLLLRA